MTATDALEAGLPRSWGEFIPTPARVRIGIVGALLLLVYWAPIRHSLVAKWLHDGNWSHGWLIPVFSLYFLASRRERLFDARPKGNYLGAVILVASLALYFVSAWQWQMGYPQSVSLVGALFGVTLLLGGWDIMRVAWFPILFLLLAIPLPNAQYVELTMPLRTFASSAAAAIMPMFAPGLYTEAQAVVIDYVMPGLPPARLNVEEACSGMRLMMAFVTLGVAMAYLRERPAWQRVVLVASCVPIAVICNTVRVTTTGLFFVYGREDLARGTPHQLLGLLMLALAFALYAAISYILNHLFVEDTEHPDTSTAPARKGAEVTP